MSFKACPQRQECLADLRDWCKRFFFKKGSVSFKKCENLKWEAVQRKEMVRETAVRVNHKVLWQRLYCTEKHRLFMAIRKQCCVYLKEQDSTKGFRDWSYNLYTSRSSWSDNYRVAMDCVQQILTLIFPDPDLAYLQLVWWDLHIL